MPKVTAVAITATALLLVALTGCADTGTSAGGGDGSTDRTSTEQTETPTPSDSPDPLVAETPGPEDAVGTDANYLAKLREALEGSGGNSIPNATDEQLLQAGHDACEQMSAGTALEDVRVVKDEPMTGVGYKDSLRIAAVAAKHFCPEFDPEG